MIAASWGIACGIIPLIIADNQSISLHLFSFGWIFCYIMAITIPFDIRDLEIDEKKKKTIPQWVGIKNAKLISYLFLCIAIALIGANLSFMPFLIMTVSFITAGMLVYFSSPTNHDYYFSFFIDGHIILQFLLVYFFC